MTDKLNQAFKNITLSVLIIVQAFFFPAVSLAETSTDDPADSTTQSAESTAEQTEPETGPSGPTGETQPTGADSHTYHENPDGTWENDLYIWDPVTKQTRPKTPQTFSYNPETDRWDTAEWYFNPASGRYEENVVSLPAASVASTGGNQASISDTGPNSNNTIDFGGDTVANFDLFYNASISNNIYQSAVSGNAGVQGNLNGGSALTGDAQSVANILNMLQSSWGELGSDEIATFVANLDGDLFGDILIDPTQIAPGSGNQDIDLTVQSDSLIDNDIEVTAQSGDANISGNTNAGSATSGDASAVVNLINMINSAIKANRSFLGVLNINGNFEGDILLPPGFLEAIIAATGPNSNNTIDAGGDTNATVSVDDDKTINNNLQLGADSGDANISGNTTSGSALTGSANTSVTLLNLTGKKVVASNALLVFVNVLGSWVGLIMDAPAGSYAVAATGPGSNNTISDTGDTNLNVDIDENSTINNDITVNAESGDANVNGNTNGGDATSGNASAGVNILNLIDSELELSDWFGVLFINVFGTWHGSFGVDTAFGNTGGKGGGAGGDTTTAVASAATAANQTFRFVARGGAGGGSGTTQTAETPTAPATSEASTTAETPAPAAEEVAAAASEGASAWLISLLLVAAGLVLFNADRLLAIFRKPQA